MASLERDATQRFGLAHFVCALLSIATIFGRIQQSQYLLLPVLSASFPPTTHLSMRHISQLLRKWVALPPMTPKRHSTTLHRHRGGIGAAAALQRHWH
jgi:hypothetical protein